MITWDGLVKNAGHCVDVVRAIATLRADFRTGRKQIFGHSLSAQAWDLIFILYIAQVEGRPIRDRDAAFVAGFDSETGKRWIAHLVKSGVLAERGEAAGTFVTMTPDATAKIEAIVAGAQVAVKPA